MPSISNVLLATRVLSYVLDKYFNAKGSNMREKVKSAEAQLGPDLTRDLNKLAVAEEVADGERAAKAEVPAPNELRATVERAWTGLRKRKPEAAAEELEGPPPTREKKAEDTSGSGWVLTAVLMFLFILALSSR